MCEGATEEGNKSYFLGWNPSLRARSRGPWGRGKPFPPFSVASNNHFKPWSPSVFTNPGYILYVAVSGDHKPFQTTLQKNTNFVLKKGRERNEDN